MGATSSSSVKVAEVETLQDCFVCGFECLVAFWTLCFENVTQELAHFGYHLAFRTLIRQVLEAWKCFGQFFGPFSAFPLISFLFTRLQVFQGPVDIKELHFIEHISVFYSEETAICKILAPRVHESQSLWVTSHQHDSMAPWVSLGCICKNTQNLLEWSEAVTYRGREMGDFPPFKNSPNPPFKPAFKA